MAKEYSGFNASFLVSSSEYFLPPSEEACNTAKVIILSFCNKESRRIEQKEEDRGIVQIRVGAELLEGTACKKVK